MKTFAQDEQTNDITTHTVTVGGVTKRYLSFNEGVKAYGDILGDVVRTLAGEIQLDTSRGIPYRDTVFRSAERIGLWRHYVLEAILAYSFVKSVDSFVANFDRSTKNLSYDINITTDGGTVTVSNT